MLSPHWHVGVRAALGAVLGSARVLLLSLLILVVSSAQAQGSPSGENQDHPRLVVGAELGLGVAFALNTRERGATSGSSEPDLVVPPFHYPKYGLAGDKLRFAWNAAAYVDVYLSREFALSTGLSLNDRGAKNDMASQPDEEFYELSRFLFLGVPLGFKWSPGNFRLGVAIVPEFGIRARHAVYVGWNDTKRTGPMEVPWGWVRRFNLASRLSFGYAIPLSTVHLVPGIQWSMHLLNDMINQGDRIARFSNVTLTVAIEYGARK